MTHADNYFFECRTLAKRIVIFIQLMSGKKKIRHFPCLRAVTENEFKKNERTIYQSSIFKKKKILVLFPKKVIFMDQINIQENFPTI